VSARIAVFASGGGTNLQALLNHFNTPVDRAARVMLVVSDRPGAAALRRAANAGVMTHEIAARMMTPEAVADDMLRVLREERIDIIALAGYLRLIPASVIEAYRDRIINVHPALLPAFGGSGMYGHHVHEAVLAAGCMLSGPTIHYVTENYDEGRIIAQWPVPVLPTDTADSLAARVLRAEHMLYPIALEAVIRRFLTAPTDATRGTPPTPPTPAAPPMPHGDYTPRLRDDLIFALRPEGPTDDSHIIDFNNY
jgi:formyltetrahydrofolate-dependent phosphoribosylglycinamide formyltransferase